MSGQLMKPPGVATIVQIPLSQVPPAVEHMVCSSPVHGIAASGPEVIPPSLPLPPLPSLVDDEPPIGSKSNRHPIATTSAATQ